MICAAFTVGFVVGVGLTIAGLRWLRFPGGGDAVTRAVREITLTRLVSEHPGLNTAQLAHLATLPEAQAETCLLTLETRGVIERTPTGWQRRRSTVRSWSRHVE